MATEVAELPLSHKVWAWFETNRKQAIWGAAGVVVLGFVVAFVIWHKGEKEITASEELSNVTVPLLLSGQRADVSGAYLKLAANYPQSSAGARALLLAAASLFDEGKYDQAKTEFEKFSREHRTSPLLPEALLGVAACLDAQGKASEATAAYKELIDRHPTSSVIPQAKFSLANLYELHNKPELAQPLFEDVMSKAGPYGSLGSEAGMRLEELQMKYPKLAPAPAAPSAQTNLAPFNLEKR